MRRKKQNLAMIRRDVILTAKCGYQREESVCGMPSALQQ